MPKPVSAKKSSSKKSSSKKSSSKETSSVELGRFKDIVTAGSAEKKFAPLKKDFYLTDIVLDLWSFPEEDDSRSACAIRLINKAAGTAETLFLWHVYEEGRQLHLNSGIFCPKGSYLTLSVGAFTKGVTADLMVTYTGYYV